MADASVSDPDEATLVWHYLRVLTQDWRERPDAVCWLHDFRRRRGWEAIADPETRAASRDAVAEVFKIMADYALDQPEPWRALGEMFGKTKRRGRPRASKWRNRTLAFLVRLLKENGMTIEEAAASVADNPETSFNLSESMIQEIYYAANPLEVDEAVAEFWRIDRALNRRG